MSLTIPLALLFAPKREESAELPALDVETARAGDRVIAVTDEEELDDVLELSIDDLHLPALPADLRLERFPLALMETFVTIRPQLRTVLGSEPLERRFEAAMLENIRVAIMLATLSGGAPAPIEPRKVMETIREGVPSMQVRAVYAMLVSVMASLAVRRAIDSKRTLPHWLARSLVERIANAPRQVHAALTASAEDVYRYEMNVVTWAAEGRAAREKGHVGPYFPLGGSWDGDE